MFNHPSRTTVFWIAVFGLRSVFADLNNDLTGIGVRAVFPGDSNYAGASAACKCLLVRSQTINLFDGISTR